jgi:hypothetical protein
MILFILIAIIILIFTSSDLITSIKYAIRAEHPCIEVLKRINEWFWTNIGLNLINIVAVWMLSIVLFFGLVFVCPSETSQWEFNINALQDNVVTEGRLYGRRGYVDGELSYFYSRTLSLGEKIEHIPANKTYVRYSDTDQPHVEVHQSRVGIPEWMYKVFFLEWMNNKNTKYYVLVVPEGTITNTGQYEIDMK